MDAERTILVVDDSQNDLYLLRIAFKKAGLNSPLFEAQSGEDAISCLKGEGAYGDRNRHPLPAVILLDLNMPRKSGFDVLSWLRSESGFKRISVIILTASLRAADVERAFDLGANAFLVKPPTLDELTELIRRLHEWLEINHFPALNGSKGERTFQ